MLPYAGDAWYRPDSVKIGYEISFNRYFYKPAPMRNLAEIRADILALENETEGLLDEILSMSGAGPMKKVKQGHFTRRLWNNGDLVGAIYRNHDRLPTEVQAELPLNQVWMLVSEEHEE